MELNQLKEAFKFQLRDNLPLTEASAKRGIEAAGKSGNERAIKISLEAYNFVGQRLLVYFAAGSVADLRMIWESELEALASEVEEVTKATDSKYTVPHLKLK